MAEADAKRRGPAWCILVGLILAFLVVRFAVLWFAFDRVFTPGYELWPMGVVANEVLLGLPTLPIFEFHDTHSGGQILSSLLAAVFFALFGTSYLVLKLVPILFALGTLILTFVFVHRRFGLPSALVAGSLLVLGPAAYIDYSSANYGNHSEVLFFIVLSLFPFYRVTVDRDASTGTHVWFGVTCGLALWYSISFLLVFVAYIGFWFCARGLFFMRRSFVAWLIGFFIGVLPFLYVMAIHSAPQGKWLLAKFIEKKDVVIDSQWERFGAYWSELIPNSACSYDLGSLPGQVLDYALTAVWLVSFLVLAIRFFPSVLRCLHRIMRPRTGRPLQPGDVVVVFLVYPFLLAGAYAFSDFAVGDWLIWEWAGYRYFMTLFLVLVFLVMIAFTELRRMGRRRTANVLALVAVLVTSLGSVGHGFDPAAAGNGLRYEGHNYYKIARILMQERYQVDRPAVFDIVRQMQKPYRVAASRGLGGCDALLVLRRDYWTHDVSFDPMELARAFPEEIRRHAAQGIGMQVAEIGRVTGDKWTMQVGVEQIYRSNRPLTTYLIHGLFLPTEQQPPGSNRQRLIANLSVLEQAPSNLRPYALQGLGMFTGRLFWRGIPQEVEMVRSLVDWAIHANETEREREAFLMGFGYACQGYWDRPRPCDRLIEELVPREHMTPIYAGIGWMSREILGIDRRALSQLELGFPLDRRGPIRVGWSYTAVDDFVLSDAGDAAGEGE